MTVRSHDIIRAIEKTAPRHLAESWDNVGLQVGSYKKEIRRVLLTLDVTDAVIQEALDRQADMIVSHHPFIFGGIKAICTDEMKGRQVATLIKNDLVLYAAHTNLDKAELGLSDYVADMIGIDSRLPLDPRDEETLYKVVIYTPVDYTEKIIDVMGKNGAGFIGRYSHCTFRTVGKGTFKPLSGTHPFIGEEGEVATVEEDRIETIVNGQGLKQLIRKIKDAHPYEEMAYDVYPLENSRLLNMNGLGKIGRLKEPMTPEAFVQMLKTVLNTKTLRAAGKEPEMIKKVALCTGSAADLMGIAKMKGADVYITGDLKYHEGQRASENGLWVIDAGHFDTEKMVTRLLKCIIENELKEDAPEILLSKCNADYIRYY